MVSMDNCSHNGDKLAAAITAFAEGWVKNGLADEAFETYVKTSGKVSFPWTMIDKITPRPDASIEEILKKDGVEELDPVVTSKNTYVAPFVNAEECQYLVIEDNFPNGRPALEKGGLIFTTRETVDKVEKMKVCTCLNPLHTALAVYGCLLGYNLISEEMKNPSLKKLVEVIGYKEGLPVVINPGILDPKEFIDTVLNVRIPNPFMPDTPQRIATDTSQKLAIRFGETIKAYAAAPSLNVADLKLIPLVFAGWLRYLMGVDDNGNAFTPSPDPMLAEASSYVADVKLGEAFDAKKTLAPILSNAKSGALTCVHSVWIRWYAITLPSLPQAQALLRQPLQNIRLNPETGQSFFLLLITSKGTARLCGSPFFYLRSLYRLLTGKHRKILLCSLRRNMQSLLQPVQYHLFRHAKCTSGLNNPLCKTTVHANLLSLFQTCLLSFFQACLFSRFVFRLP